MKAQLAATAICALLALQPAWSQQSQQSVVTPNRAEPTPTSNPPADPFKNGGRPESHGGTVHAPQMDSGGPQTGVTPLSGDARQAVEDLARSTLTAEQYGNLASMRHTSGAVHELADRMIITNSRINRALAAAAPDLRNKEQMPAQERGTFDSIARDAGEVQFGVSIAQWVAQTYPTAISALERLGQDGQFRELASSALPEMQSQLSEARHILQTARAVPNGQPSSTGTIPDPKTKSD